MNAPRYYSTYAGGSYGYFGPVLVGTYVVLMSRYRNHEPDPGSYLDDGSWCGDSLHCASECCATNPDDTQ